jgi:hypothetical protein
MAAEFGSDRAGMDGVGADAAVLESFVESDAEEDIGRLGLTVSNPFVVVVLLEEGVVESEGRQAVAGARLVDDASGGAGEKRRYEARGLNEMAEVVRAELGVQALRGAADRAGHDARVVDESVDAREAACDVLRAATDGVEVKEVEDSHLDVGVRNAFANRGRGCLAFGFVANDADDLRTAGREDPGSLDAEASGAAGDDDRLSGKVHVSSCLLCAGFGSELSCHSVLLLNSLWGGLMGWTEKDREFAVSGTPVKGLS